MAIIHRQESGMDEQQSDPVDSGRKIDGLAPEQWSQRQAKRAFIFAVLTPVWWVVMLMLINILAEVFPSTSPDSSFVFGLWGFMALVFTGTVVYTGIQQMRLIRQYDERRGLWLARGAVVVGTAFLVLSVVIIVAIFTGDDAATRPAF